uniref:Uncharacterized protein n=1 Tax=Rhizophora mucronata TaxID=61149 RepID=A0A2P2Q3C6_RHIMU
MTLSYSNFVYALLSCIKIWGGHRDQVQNC